MRADRAVFRRGVVAAALLLAMPVPAIALDPSRRITEYVYDQWRIPDGLPQESVTAILQSRDGYLWFGTLDGLVRFDGVTLETFNLIEAAGMETNVVLALTESVEGGVWVGTRGGVALVRDGRFTVFGADAGLTDAYVRSLATTRDGTLLVGTRLAGLHTLAGARFTQLTTTDGLADNDIRSIAVDANGHTWLATPGGLTRIADGRPVAVRVGPSAESNRIIALHLGGSGRLWVGTNDGLWAITPGRGDAADGPYLAGFQVRAVLEDGDGNVWAGTTSGFARLQGGRVEMAPAAARMSQSHVRSLALDREGSLWVGTDGGGVGRYRNPSVTMVRPGLGGESDTLMAVHQDQTGTMWFGANCGGLIEQTPTGMRAHSLQDGLPDACVRVLASQRDGTLWIGTLHGLAQRRNGRISRLSDVDGLASGSITTLAVGRTDTLWVGTNDAGLYHLADGRVTRHTSRTGLSSDDVRVVLEGRDGALWIGTFGGGLNRLADGRITVFGRNEGLPNTAVLALLEDPDGTLWVGTNGGGLARLRGKVFTTFTTATGLYHNGIFSIVDDGRGFLWMGSNRGIFRVSRTELDEVARGVRERVTSMSLSIAEGLRNGGVWGGASSAGIRSADGRLWFATIDGAAVVDPARLPKNTTPPLVLVGRLVVDGRDWPTRAVPRLAAGSREIEIAYTALSFVLPSRVRFQYRLVGFDDAWIDAGARRAAYFTNLKPGAYRFEVKAANNDGVWSEGPASIAFEVAPHIYQTWTFVLAVAGVVIGLGFGFYRIRVAQLHAQQRRLSEQVQKALADIKVLTGLLPICASCKRIRDDANQWSELETYIHRHSQAEFTHGICPDCIKTLYPDEDHGRR